jgi:hypothetical protein
VRASDKQRQPLGTVEEVSRQAITLLVTVMVDADQQVSGERNSLQVPWTEIFSVLFCFLVDSTGSCNYLAQEIK